MENIKYRPISIPKQTVEKFLEQDDPIKLMGLYMFYYHTAIWQKTNTVRATTTFTAKALKISQSTVAKLRKTLLELGFIQDIVRRDTNGKIVGRYIKVRYYAKKTTPLKNHTLENPGQGFLGTNAYSKKVNAYSKKTIVTGRKTARKCVGNNTPLTGKDNSFTNRYGAKIQRRLKIHSKYKPATAKAWGKEIYYILHDMGVAKDRFRDVMGWYLKNFKSYQHAPAIYRVKDLSAKFLQIEDAMRRYYRKTEESDVEEEIIY